jgi:hypothetical protein
VQNFEQGTDLFEIGSDTFNDDDNRQSRFSLEIKNLIGKSYNRYLILNNEIIYLLYLTCNSSSVSYFQMISNNKF